MLTSIARLASQRLVLLFIVSILFSQAAFAMPASPRAYTEKQPDGSEISLRIRGDEHYNWVEDSKGYTVVRNKGWYEYAEAGIDGRLQPTGLIVGRDNPETAGLERGLTDSMDVRAASAKTIEAPDGLDGPIMNVPPLGTVKNLVVMVRFSNHVGRSLPSAADMDVLFNTVGGDPSLAPTGSVKDVYFENSYGQMTLESDINPGINDWITVSNTEQYYANGSSGDSTLWQALREALDILDNVVDFNDYDLDNNGRIDSIAFIHSGYAAEWGGNDTYGTNYVDRIWSHRWAIQPQWNSDEGVSVFDYHISPGVWGTSGSDIGRIGVIAHETGHFFGLPDLYDTDGNGSGIGSWGLMANSWDFNFTQLCPPHFSPWSKVDLGWYTPTVIDQPGQYSINQAETNPEVYRIDANFPSSEYLMIENRQNAGFDCTIPQGGLVIWHIDDSTGYNTQGYPGQSGWPGNGNHYRVAVLQADGDYDMERDINRGDSGDTHHAAGVDAIGPGPGNHPNTDAYKNGNIIVTGHIISDISASGPSMTFCLNGCTGIPAPSGLSATAQGTSSIALGWTDNSSSEDGFNIERSSNGTNWSALASTGANVTTYDDNGLDPDSTWYYRVRAYEAADTSAWSNTANATTDDVPPDAPTNMQASAASQSQINLSWVDQAGNEDSYRLERSDEAGGPWGLLANLGANSTNYSDTGLAASEDYFYRVRAENAFGESGWAQASATTDDPPPFVDYTANSQTTPEGSVSGATSLTHADDSSAQSITEQQSNGNPRKRRSSLETRYTFNITAGNSATLFANAWSGGSSDNDEFEFHYSTDGSNYVPAFVVSSGSSGNVQSAVLPSNHSGNLYVRVRDTDNTQGNSAQDTVFIDHLYIRVDNTPATPPADPSGLGANAVAWNQVNLNWTDNANDETGYEVERAVGAGGFSLLTTLGANSTNYSDTSVNAETTYTYRVRAVKGATTSGYSNQASDTTPAEPPPVPPADPTGLGAVAVSHNQVDIDWNDNATDETGYEVERAVGGGGFSLLTTLGANANSFSDTSVDPNTQYTYRVRAVKSGLYSGYSNQASATTPGQPAISLSVTGYKVRGRHHADLTWSGASGAQVDVHRNTTVYSTANDGSHTDEIGTKGGATYEYQVCETGTSTCSNTVTIVF